MKVFAAILLAPVTLVGCQSIRHGGNTPLSDPTPETLRIATYNVHYIILGRD